MFIKRLLLITSITLVISACTSMSFKAMYKMATLDPLTIKPDELVLALRTDQAVDIGKGTVEMKLAFSGPAYQQYEAVERDHAFLVEVEKIDVEQTVTPYSEILLDGIEANEQVTILKLNPADAAQMAETQKIIKRYRESEVKGKGMFSFGFNQSCIIRSEYLESLPVDLFLKTSNDEEFFMFFDDLDVIEQARDQQMDLKQVNKC